MARLWRTKSHHLHTETTVCVYFAYHSTAIIGFGEKLAQRVHNQNEQHWWKGIILPEAPCMPETTGRDSVQQKHVLMPRWTVRKSTTSILHQRQDFAWIPTEKWPGNRIKSFGVIQFQKGACTTFLFKSLGQLTNKFEVFMKWPPPRLPLGFLQLN